MNAELKILVLTVQCAPTNQEVTSVHVNQDIEEKIAKTVFEGQQHRCITEKSPKCGSTPLDSNDDLRLGF